MCCVDILCISGVIIPVVLRLKMLSAYSSMSFLVVMCFDLDSLLFLEFMFTFCSSCVHCSSLFHSCLCCCLCLVLIDSFCLNQIDSHPFDFDCKGGILVFGKEVVCQVELVCCSVWNLLEMCLECVFRLTA